MPSPDNLRAQIRKIVAEAENNPKDDIPSPQELLRQAADKPAEVMVDENPKDAAASAEGRVQLHLVPGVFKLLVARVLAFGAQKYGAFNWRSGPKINAMTYVSAIQRHLDAYVDGEDRDAESGLPHLAHAGAGLAILCDAISVGKLNDDRPPPGITGEALRAVAAGPPKIAAVED